jgi:hypothetical protein
MRLSGSLAALAAVGAGLVSGGLFGCGGGGLSPDSGGTGGGAGAGTPPDVVDPMDLLSDFEQGRAIVLPLGDPARNGAWYSYNDVSPGCLQSPAHGASYFVSTPAELAPGVSHGRALHVNFNNCSNWGAGVGADFNSPMTDGGVVPARPRVPYDVSPYKGVAFWAMASPGTDVTVRLKMVMRVSTEILDGGLCDEAALGGADSCGDEWGAPFVLPGDGAWKAVTVRFSDSNFKQESWGNPFAWNPTDILGVQFQSVREHTGLYDFWIDDIYLVR